MSNTAPAIVGVAQVVNREDSARSPVELMTEAITTALEDAGVPGLVDLIDILATVPVIAWRYRDPGQILAAQLGLTPRETWYPPIGGNTPQMLVNRAAEAIADGTARAAIVVGGEAYRSRMRARRMETDLHWETQDESVHPTWPAGEPHSLDSLLHPAELASGLVMPTSIYPMFETALRHHLRNDNATHERYLGALWGRYAEVARTNPYAWSSEVPTADEITRITESNRLIGYPYTKRMVSNPDVDMASAVVLISAETARDIGIDPDRLVYIHAGADATDPFVVERESFVSSTAIRAIGAALSEHLGCECNAADQLDIYSCFPSAVTIACLELGLDRERTLTTTGGLCFAGGPWNNPVGHSIAAMTEVLRANPSQTGLVTANGGNLQKHSAGWYSAQPPTRPFRRYLPLGEGAIEREVNFVEGYRGPARIEAYTVMHERDGRVGRSHCAVRTPDGDRALAFDSSDLVASQLESADMIGVAVVVGEDEFSFV